MNQKPGFLCLVEDSGYGRSTPLEDVLCFLEELAELLGSSGFRLWNFGCRVLTEMGATWVCPKIAKTRDCLILMVRA